MEYIENMTFEEASKALIDELNANLATLHQNYHVEQSDWNKLYDQIANVVSEETHLPVFSPGSNGGATSRTGMRCGAIPE